MSGEVGKIVCCAHCQEHKAFYTQGVCKQCWEGIQVEMNRDTEGVEYRVRELGAALEHVLAEDADNVEPVEIRRVRGWRYQVTTEHYGLGVLPVDVFLQARSMREVAEELATEMRFAQDAKARRILSPERDN